MKDRSSIVRAIVPNAVASYLLNEKRTEATVYAKVGLEGTPGAADASTREFKLTHEEHMWKMQLAILRPAHTRSP